MEKQEAPPGYTSNPGSPLQQGYAPQPGYYPPPQDVVGSPQQGYPPPQQGYVPPQQGYVHSQQGYAPPPQGYPPPQQGYAQPQYQPNMVNTAQPGGQQTFVTQTTVVTQPNSVSGMRAAIPELPMALAIIYCILNFIFPGFGTILAGFSVLCCGNVGQSGGGRFGTFCLNFWVGVAQMVLASFLVGWIWSIVWGYAFIALSAEGSSRQANQTTVVTTTQHTNPV